MPTSYTFFKQEIKQWFLENIPTSKRILDVGPGEGTYANLLRSSGYRIDAVEIHGPYVDKYKLRDLYDNVYINDILNFDIQDYDVIILGDVLEHIIPLYAQGLIRKIKNHGQQCLVAVPYMMSQEESEGNPHEAHHQEDLTPELMKERYSTLQMIYSNEYYGYYTFPETKHEKAFVLYATESYAQTVQGCVNSLNAFSTIPIFVYMLNSDIQINGVVSINWKCDALNPKQEKYIDRASLDIYKILIQRPLIVKDALEKYANVVTYVDADSIATEFVNNIFDYFPKDNEFPYFVEGIYEFLKIGDRGGAIDYDNLNTTLEAPVCELFKSDQKERINTKYRQTGYFVAGQKCIDFLEIWNYRCRHPLILKSNSYYCSFNEETVLQTMLYDYKIYNGLPLIYCNGLLTNEIEYKGYSYMVKEWLKIPAKKSEHLFFHGEKDLNKMNDFINHLKNK